MGLDLLWTICWRCKVFRRNNLFYWSSSSVSVLAVATPLLAWPIWIIIVKIYLLGFIYCFIHSYCLVFENVWKISSTVIETNLSVRETGFSFRKYWISLLIFRLWHQLLVILLFHPTHLVFFPAFIKVKFHQMNWLYWKLVSVTGRPYH